MPKVVDACCTINLCAAGNLLTLLPSLGAEWYVPALVAGETLYLRRPDPDDAAKLVKERIDLKPIFDAGVLRTCDAESAEEIATFVDLAVILDDGEAMSLAIAKHRGWTLATDDRKARRVAAERGVPVLTTTEIVKSWADTTRADESAVASILRNIQTFGNFVPHRTMPLHAWWVDLLDRVTEG